MRMEAPVQHDLALFRNWFKRPSMGAHPLLGIDRMSWNGQNEGDLAALMPRRAHDRFSQWFIDSLVPRLHHIFRRKSKVTLLNIYYCGVSHEPYSKQSPATWVRGCTSTMNRT
jgi:hypothetical protein